MKFKSFAAGALVATAITALPLTTSAADIVHDLAVPAPRLVILELHVKIVELLPPDDRYVRLVGQPVGSVAVDA